MLEFQLATTLDGYRRTKHAASVAQHIVHLFGGNEFRRHNEVALVFAVFVVNNDDELSFFEVLNGFFDSGKFEIVHILMGDICLLYIYVGVQYYSYNICRGKPV